MKQQTFGAANFEKYGKQTRKGKFLEEMDAVIPWQELVEAVEPCYPQPQSAGRRPVGIERMLRIHFLQQWFSLSDPGVEEALYDSRAMREFVGVDLGEERAPDETTICKFRHMLERHGLGEAGISDGERASEGEGVEGIDGDDSGRDDSARGDGMSTTCSSLVLCSTW